MRRPRNEKTDYIVLPSTIGKNGVLRTSSIIEPLLIEEVKTSKGSYKVEHNDIYYLLNQERLNNIGIDTIKSWLQTLEPCSDSLSELRAKCSDKELLSLVKSRHIQSPSELLAWSDYLKNKAEELSAPARELVDSTDDVDTSDTTEPSNASDNDS